jgi:Pilus formation protein N terminal region
MTALFERIWRWRRRQHRLTRALLMSAAFLAAAVTMGSVRAADFITVYLDQAKVTKLPDRVATLVIGNPLIADVTLQRGGMIIITGKGYGITNLIALDAAGAVLREQSIEVRGPREDVVVVYRGVNRESYSCTPNCERRITLGDNPEYFAAALGEAGDRSSRAQGTAATSGR